MKTARNVLILVLLVTLLFTISTSYALETGESPHSITHDSFIGGSYEGEGTFVRPRGISYYNGHLYIADTHAQTIQKLDAAYDDGTYEVAYDDEFGKSCPDVPGYLNDVLDVCVDDNGDIYVTDIDNIMEIYNSNFSHDIRIGRYNYAVNNGDFESWESSDTPFAFNKGYSDTTTGLYQRTDWKTSGDYSLGANPRSGYVEVTQIITEQIESGVSYTASIYAITDFSDKSKLVLYMMFLDSNDQVLNTYSVNGSTGGIVSFQMNQMSVTATAPANTAKVKLWVRTYANSTGSVAWDDLALNETGWNNKFSYPRSVAVDSNGNIYVTDTYNHQLYKFDSDREYSTSIGSYGTGNGNFYNPYDIAIDTNDNKYIVDYSNNRIQKLNNADGYTTQWGSSGSGNGQFSEASAIAVDTDDGVVYVADSGNHRIQAFDTSGNFLWAIGSCQYWESGTSAPTVSSGTGDLYFNHPEGIAIDAVNNILFVADTYNDRIYYFKLDSNGDYDDNYSTFGSTRQAENGKLLRAVGMAEDSSGNLYVTDIFNSQVQKFNSSGTYLSTIGSYGSGMGQSDYPNECYIGTDGKLYVVDAFNSRVNIYYLDGTVNSSDWKIGTGTEGTGDGDLMLPMYITQDTNNRFIVTEWTSTKYSSTAPGRVSIFNADRTYYGDLYVPQASGVAVDPNTGVIYICSASENKIYMYDSSYTYLGTFGQKGRDGEDGFFHAPLDIIIGDEQFIYIADYRNNQIQMYDLNWEFIRSFGSFGTGNDNLIYPDALLKSGNKLYVSEWCNDRVNVLEVDPPDTLNNASFERWGDGTRPTFWQLGFSNITYGTGITEETSTVYSGSEAIKMVSTPSSSYVEAKNHISVDASTQYAYSVWVNTNASDKSRIQMYAVYYDEKGDVISSSSTTGSSFSISNNTWTQMSFNVTTPSTAVSVKLYLRFIGGDSAQCIWDDVSFQ